MQQRLERDVRFLKAWAVISTLGLVVMGLSAFRQEKTRFGEIDVERINVVEPDGKLRMVLSNRPRSIGPVYKGKPFGYAGGTRPGIIFFNDEGTENGGLTFTGKQEADGKYQASSHFSFDQFNSDQVLYFSHQEENGRKRSGFTVAERADKDIMDLVTQRDSIVKATAEGPTRNAALQQWAQQRPGGRPMFAQRVWMGRDMNRTALLTLADPEGRVRLRFAVDSLGAAAVEFLDEKGQVTSRLPAR